MCAVVVEVEIKAELEQQLQLRHTAEVVAGGDPP